MKTTSSILANYRIYDRTGGGVTEDIIAENLEDAIQQGRDWIEAGDWEQGNDEETLDCCVREIVRYPEPDENGKATGSDGEDLHLDEDGDLVDAEGCLYCTPADFGGIDEDATWAADRHDCSGTLAGKDAPECVDGDCEGHDWKSPYSLLGGCKENPGVWGSGHGQVAIKSVCACCGLYRTTDYGATKYNDAWNRANADRGFRYNALANLSGTGQQAVNQITSTGMNAANNAGNLTTSGGAARAAGLVGSANAIGNGITGAGNSLLQYQMFNKLFPNDGTAGNIAKGNALMAGYGGGQDIYSF